MSIKLVKKQQELICECCNFVTHVTRDYTNHLCTKKHKRNAEYQQDLPIIFTCTTCNKNYNDRTGLWRHIKKNNCSLPIINIIIEDHIIEKQTILEPVKNYDLIAELLKQNNDLQKQIIELAKEPKIVNNNYNNNNNTNNNTTNNQFNLNMFLNEECKNALNIDDFMDSLQLTVEDLEQTGELGFVQGMTRIFMKGLKDLDITMRPFHCTDIKRETVYIKDQDKWEKETTEKKLMKQALNQVVRKNLKMIHVWREDHPDYLRSNTKDNDEYNKISISSLGSAYDDEQLRMDEKIIRNVLKEVILDRKANS